MRIENIKQLTEVYGLSVALRTDDLDLWSDTLARCSYVPVLYTNASIEFQWAYQRGQGGDWDDISLLAYLDNKPVAVWPLSLSYKEGKTMLSSHGLPVLPPLFVADCPVSSRKRFVKGFLDFAHAIATENGLDSWECVESFNNTNGLSHWHAESLSRGASCAVYHEIFLDLGLSVPEIRAHFRKSYKPLITSGMRLWTVGVLEVANESIWNEFRELHFRVSGRKTRSDETWHLHLLDIKAQRAFLVYLRDSSDQMVGAGFFNFTCDEGLYAVGAYDRSLFDKPLGHVVQYRAIEELKNRGVRWYKIGVRPYRSEATTLTDKEISIGKFKQGFASHLFPRFILRHLTLNKEQLD